MANERLSFKLADGRVATMVNLVDFVWIIESDTLGIFRAFDRSETTGKYGPRWLRADHIHRRSREAWSTNDSEKAKEMLGRVLEHHTKAYLVRMVRKG